MHDFVGLIAFTTTDNYTMVAVYRQEDGRRKWEAWGRMELRAPEVVDLADPTLQEVIEEELGAVEPQLAELTEADYVVASEEELGESSPDLEMLGEDGDPGDRILPEEMVRSGDPVEDEGLAEDIADLERSGELMPVVDGVFVAYHVVTHRNHRNPYGSRHSFAGVTVEFKCGRAEKAAEPCRRCKEAPGRVRCPYLGKGATVPCVACAEEHGVVDPLDGAVQFATPCWVAWERHPVTWEDAKVVSLPAFFQVVAVLPRWPRPTWRNIRTRDGRVVRVQEKDAPHVVVRWGDLDEEGNFVPGWLDERTGERVERYSILPAWALYNVKTGERFRYEEPSQPVRLNRRFRAQVLKEVTARYPQWWKRVIHPRKDLGAAWWKADVEDERVTVRFAYPDGRVCTVVVPVIDGRAVDPLEVPNVGETNPFPAGHYQERLFALQVATWRLVERELAAEVN